MAKANPPLDVLILGEHPSAYLAAALLLTKPGINVAHATIPGEHAPDRLVSIYHNITPAEWFLGFHPHLTGRQNLVTSARLLGLDDAVIEDRTESIIDFAELPDELHAPTPSASASFSEMSSTRSTRTFVISSVMRESNRGM